MIQITQSVCRPGSARANEDFFWHNAETLVLLDGSTSLVSAGGFDAVWFVRGFVRQFSEAIAEKPLPEAVNHALDALYAEFTEAVGTAAGPEIFPSAAAMFFHLDGKTLQILNLGDCTALLFGAAPRKLYCDDVSRLDGLVIAELERLHHETGEDISALVSRPEIREMLVRNRKQMNQPGGYRILSFGMPACTAADLTELPAADVSEIFAFSDGFSAMEPQIHPGCDLDALYTQLRSEESADCALNRHPRFKAHDDASAVAFRIL